MKSFDDKVAAITGAGSGIGRALAVQLAEQRCHLALSDIDEAGLEATAVECRGRGVRVTAERVDVADREAVYGWAGRVVIDHGRVNLIFNNAGVGLASTIDAMRYEDFEWLMGINFWGVVYGTKAFLPHLQASGEGHVINVSSVFGLAGIPTQGAYNAAKFAVRGFTECLRQELEMADSPVSATSVHPGGIKTGIARSARRDESMAKLGLDPTDLTAKSEKAFITTPERAAAQILRAVRRNQRRVLVGPDARVYDALTRVLPSGYQNVAKWFARRTLR